MNKILNKGKYINIANHEAGHYVVATVLGFRLGNIKLQIFKSKKFHHKASVDIFVDEPLINMDSVLAFCERRVQVLYAGAIAETLLNGNIDMQRVKNILEDSAKRDFDKIWVFNRIINNIKNANAITADEKHNGNLALLIDNELKRKSQNLVLQNKDVILEIGEKLIEGITDDNKEYCLAKQEINSLPLMVKALNSRKLSRK